MHIVLYDDPLYRADVSLGTLQLPTSAARVYGTVHHRYFTLLANETAPYQRRAPNMFVYTWIPTRPLALFNLFHLPTRNAIYAAAPPPVQEALDHSFPVRAGIVRRVSEADAVAHDNTCLAHICTLGYDGYITQPREGNTFHSEVGICGRSLEFLEMREPAQRAWVPPAVEERRSTVSKINQGMTGSKLFFQGGKGRKTRRRLMRPNLTQHGLVRRKQTRRH